jgi:hypothetical protein
MGVRRVTKVNAFASGPDDAYVHPPFCALGDSWQFDARLWFRRLTTEKVEPDQLHTHFEGEMKAMDRRVTRGRFHSSPMAHSSVPDRISGLGWESDSVRPVGPLEPLSRTRMGEWRVSSRARNRHVEIRAPTGAPGCRGGPLAVLKAWARGMRAALWVDTRA